MPEPRRLPPETPIAQTAKHSAGLSSLQRVCQTSTPYSGLRVAIDAALSLTD